MVSRPRPHAPEQQINRLVTRVDRTENAAPLKSTSVTDGRTRFVGNESLIVEGSAKVEGWLIVTGNQRVVGTIEVQGDGVFSGNVDITGDVTQTGTYTIPGALPIVIEIVNGQPQVSVGGGYVRGFQDGVAMGQPGGGIVTATSAGAGIARGAYSVAIADAGMGFTGVPSVPADDVQFWYGENADGYLVKVSKASGGPGGSGDFAWPFPLAYVTREYGPGYTEYEDGVHKGIDFSGGPAVGGAPIPASSGGTVQVKAFDVERGNYIILNHGTRDGFELTTRYYHLQSPSPLSVGDPVTKGQSVGSVGTTGTSTGDHLHFETRRNGEHMNPRSFMEIYGE